MLSSNKLASCVAGVAARRFSAAAGVSVSKFFDACKQSGVGYFAGVPDSLLKDFCAYVTDNASAKEHVIAANEGTAVGLAAGFHLATGSIPMVYAQNSGFGNMVNPLLSLADKKVYSLPMLLLIGWRGEPGVKDEPQHVVMGSLQEDMIKAMQLDYAILPTETEAAIETLKLAVDKSKSTSAPYVLLVRKDTFEKYKIKTKPREVEYPLSREQALDVITEACQPNTAFVGTTGVLSRELYELRDSKFGSDHSHDFLCVGNMGHSSAIANAIAAFQPDRPVVCLDGDGAALMHMGAFATTGQSQTNNMVHILLNNGLHESVGAQPTVGFDVDFCAIAKACGYCSTVQVSEPKGITAALKSAFAASSSTNAPALVEVRVKPGVRSDLGRPKTSPAQNKAGFMEFLQK